ncbi:hypothetical protein IV62_GL000327 [Lactobacillus helveticus]|nr:hypothetical protein IV62_GL000327 [Lactobacillus helveticus]
MIAATLLAVSPVVIDNVNHNNGNAIVKAAVNQPGDMVKPYKVKSSYDGNIKENKPNKVRWTSELTTLSNSLCK